MGIDWRRMRPNANAPEAELRRLVDLQAEAFQKLRSSSRTCSIDPIDGYDEAERGHFDHQYLESSRALAALLDFPAYEESTCVARDHPELALSWRVYPITQINIFPCEWQVQAHRTYLPGALREQLSIWIDWVSAIAAGRHRQFLLDLYLHHTSVDINDLYRDTREVVEASLTSTSRWATKPALVSARDQLLSFQVPAVHPAPVHPPPPIDLDFNLADNEPHNFINTKVHELIALTRSYDANVKQGRKIGYYEKYYMTFDSFLARANDEWLHQFLAWAEACRDYGMGLYLDYETLATRLLTN